MEFFFVLGLILVLASPVAVVVAFVSLSRTRRLQEEVDRLSGLVFKRDLAGSSQAEEVPATPVVTPPPAPAPAVVPVAERPTPPPAPPVPPAPSTPPRREPRRDLERILGGQWLTWVGIIAIFFGTAFFLGVDLGRSAMSGFPQILVGLAVAAIFHAVGRYWSVRQESYLGLGLLGGGMALLYLSAYASHGFHDLIQLWLVFPLLMVVATVGAFLALDRNSLVIAALTLIGAFLTPVLLRDGSDPVHALLPYLAAVNLGAVLVGVRRGWAGLTLGAFVATLFMVGEWWVTHYQTSLRLFTFVSLTAIWLIYTIAPWLRGRVTPFWSVGRALVLAGSGLFYGLACYSLLAGGYESLQGLSLMLLAMIYYGLSRYRRARQGDDEATRLAHYTGVALALVAIPIQLDLAWVTLSWTALAGVLIYAGLRERDVWQRLSGLIVLVVVLIRSSIVDLPWMASSTRTFQPIINGEFLAGLALSGLLGWVSWAYHRYSDRLTERERWARPAILIVGVVLLAWKLSMEIMGWVDSLGSRQGVNLISTGFLYLTLLWAWYGLAAVMVGLRHAHRPLRATGLFIMGLSVVATAMMTVAGAPDLGPSVRPVINLRFLQQMMVSGAMGLLFWSFTRYPDLYSAREQRWRMPTLIIGVILFGVKMSQEVHGIVMWGGGTGNQSVLYQAMLWVIYGLGLAQVGLRYRQPLLRCSGYLFMLASLMTTLVITLSRGVHLVSDYRPIANLPLMQGLTLALAFGGLFWAFHRWQGALDKRELLFRTPLLMTAVLLMFFKVSMEVEGFFHLRGFEAAASRDVKSLLTLSLVWAIYAGLVVVAGFITRFKPLRLLGIGLLLLTVLKVFLVDVGALDQGYRIAAFVVLGVLLLAVSLLYQRSRRWEKDQD